MMCHLRYSGGQCEIVINLLKLEISSPVKTFLILTLI